MGSNAEQVLIARLATPRAPYESPGTILRQALTAYWPKEVRVKFLVTPGGFVWGEFPRVGLSSGGWDSRDSDLPKLASVAETHARKHALRPPVLRAARDRVNTITLGVDLGEPGTDQPHAELVGVYDVQRDAFVRWTGKSYPTPFQQHSLVHVTNLGSHLVKIHSERVLILGCHDLNMFSGRAWANQKPGSHRRVRCAEMRKVAAQFQPTVVLHHPHSTDSSRIWSVGWGGVKKREKTVRAWASGIHYHNGGGGKPRTSLESVLRATASGDPHVIDVVVPKGS